MNGDWSSVDLNVVKERPPTLIMIGSVIDMAVSEKTKRIVDKGCEAAGQFDSEKGAWLDFAPRRCCLKPMMSEIR